MSAPEVDAVFFDVFGTVVDWYGGVVRDGERLGEEKGLEVDWCAFAVAWWTRYLPSMDRVRGVELPWTKLDALHRASLEELLEEFGVRGLAEEEKEEFNCAWHRLDPWPDAVAGIERVRGRHTVAALSNGNVSLLTDMAKRARLPWDVILSAEMVRRYKPDPGVYLMAAELLDVRPERAIMVACHDWDLGGAKEAGLRTALVRRPLEWGPRQRAAYERRTDESGYDVVADDLPDLARKLGA
jgi:2-haloacid dehalogenase